MKTIITTAAALALAVTLNAADAGQDEVIKAAKKLADAGTYAWKSTSETSGGGGGGGGGGGAFRAGPTEGKIGKDGVIMVTMTRGDSTIEGVVKGEKAAIKTPDEGWQAVPEAGAGGGGGGQANRGMFMGRMLRTMKPPAAEAQTLAAKVKELKKADGLYSGDLTEDGVKELLSFGRRPGGGGNAPEVTGAKGSAKFWVKDGVLSKYEYNVKGKMTIRDQEREIDRTTTVEIKDVGTAKVNAPEEALKKL